MRWLFELQSSPKNPTFFLLGLNEIFQSLDMGPVGLMICWFFVVKCLRLHRLRFPAGYGMYPFLLGGGEDDDPTNSFCCNPKLESVWSHERDSFVQQASFWPPEQPCISYPSCLDKKEPMHSIHIQYELHYILSIYSIHLKRSNLLFIQETPVEALNVPWMPLPSKGVWIRRGRLTTRT